MIARFGLDRVNQSPASFDPEKLLWLAGEYMRMLPLEQKVEGVIPFLKRAGLLGADLDESDRGKIARVAQACGDRLKIFSDILLYGAFFFRDPEYDPAAVEKRLRKPGAIDTLRSVSDILRTAEPFEARSLEDTLQTFCQERGMKPGDLNHILRVAATGVTIGPGLFDCLAILGRAETLRRIETATRLAT
jgi:nondiscriminating glutamyl-tRNA synthetase